jgi:heat shock protein HslJ
MKKFMTTAMLVATIGNGAAAMEMLPGSEWGPVELGGEAFEPIQEIFLRFEQDGFYFGNAGCNTIRGMYVTNDTAILLSPAAATMMACPEDISKQEFAFVQALMSVREHTRDGTSLELKDGDGSVVMKLQQRDAD